MGRGRHDVAGPFLVTEREDGRGMVEARWERVVGGILAHDTTLDDLQSRVSDDPFVAQNVVTAEILEIAPSRADERLSFLLG